MQADLYERLTRDILDNVDTAGEWIPPWDGATGMPSNGVTGARYRGINVPILWAARQRAGYLQNRWATYRTWAANGCQVKRGEKSVMIGFFDRRERELADGSTEVRMIARSFLVFNADQVTGDLAAPPTVSERTLGEKIEAAERVIAESSARILNDGTSPRYVPALDTIHMPLEPWFHHREGYYNTLFHELGHWTGHKDRLDRLGKTKFGSDVYAMEELVAEMTAAFVCAECGITSRMREDHVPYIAHWLTVLKRDKTAIVKASSLAQQAADFLMKRTTGTENDHHARIADAALAVG